MEVTVTLQRMSTEEARACVDQIKTNLETVRERLFELHEREGWKSLEYPTWQACIQAEFHMSRTRAHQLLNAHRVDQILAAPYQEVAWYQASTNVNIEPVAKIEESHARELAPLIRQPEKLREVYADVVEQTEGKPTAPEIRAAVERHIESERTPAPPPFVMPVQEEESEEERAYFLLARQRLIARYVPGAVAAAAADPSAALPAWEEFERWFREFMVVLRARASRPIRLAE